jgi:hypothetical protein
VPGRRGGAGVDRGPSGLTLVWLTWWPIAYVGALPRATVGEPTSAARVLSVARHPSASRERLQALVSALPWRVLQESWRSSSKALPVARTDAERLALVQLREVLLDEMETSHPRSFARWCTRSHADR